MMVEIATNANDPESRKSGCSGVKNAQTRNTPLMTAKKPDWITRNLFVRI